MPAPRPEPVPRPKAASSTKAISEWLDKCPVTRHRAGFSTAELVAAMPAALRGKTSNMVIGQALRRDARFEKVRDGFWRNSLLTPGKAAERSGRRRASRCRERPPANVRPAAAGIRVVCMKRAKGV
jgi:hypothetical protein